MCWAEQGCQFHLKAEEGMPEEVTDAPDAKKCDTQDRNSIPWRKSSPPGVAFAEVANERQHEENRYSQETGVEDDMPGGKEGIYNIKVIMRPTIAIHASQKPATEEKHDPIKSDTTNH